MFSQRLPVFLRDDLLMAQAILDQQVVGIELQGHPIAAGVAGDRTDS